MEELVNLNKSLLSSISVSRTMWEVTGGHKSYLTAIGKMPLIGTLIFLVPWSYVIDSYAGWVFQGSNGTCNTFSLEVPFVPFAFD